MLDLLRVRPAFSHEKVIFRVRRFGRGLAALATRVLPTVRSAAWSQPVSGTETEAVPGATRISSPHAEPGSLSGIHREAFLLPGPVKFKNHTSQTSEGAVCTATRK